MDHKLHTKYQKKLMSQFWEILGIYKNFLECRGANNNRVHICSLHLNGNGRVTCNDSHNTISRVIYLFRNSTTFPRISRPSFLRFLHANFYVIVSQKIVNWGIFLKKFQDFSENSRSLTLKTSFSTETPPIQGFP